MKKLKIKVGAYKTEYTNIKKVYVIQYIVENGIENNFKTYFTEKRSTYKNLLKQNKKIIVGAGKMKLNKKYLYAVDSGKLGVAKNDGQ